MLSVFKIALKVITASYILQITTLYIIGLIMAQ